MAIFLTAFCPGSFVSASKVLTILFPMSLDPKYFLRDYSSLRLFAGTGCGKCNMRSVVKEVRRAFPFSDWCKRLSARSGADAFSGTEQHPEKY